MDILMDTLRTLAKVILSGSFIMLNCIIGFILYRRNKKVVNVQKSLMGSSYYSAFDMTISQIVMGLIAGILCSVILALLHIKFDSSGGVLLLLILSLILMKIRPRFICFSYAFGVLGVLYFMNQILSEYFGISSVAFLDLNIVSLAMLIGVLHLIEGILILIDGTKSVTPIVCVKNDEFVGGFVFRRYWVLPLVFCMIGNMNDGSLLWFIPAFVMIGYNSITFTRKKGDKLRVSALSSFIYGILLIFIAGLGNLSSFMEFILVIYVPLAHEFMLKLEYYLEIKGKYKFINNEDGILVLDVVHNSLAYTMGICSGDKIVEINNNRITSEKELVEGLKNIHNYLELKVKKVSGEIRDIKYSNEFPKNKKIGMIYVPKKNNIGNKGNRGDFISILHNVIEKHNRK